MAAQTLDNTIKAVFTATKGHKTSKRHALADAFTDITVCGVDTTTGFYKGGMHHIPQEVTCLNCVRILTKRPIILIEITSNKMTAHLPADHSQCEHTGLGQGRDNHDSECSIRMPCDCYYGCKCECDCELSDSACDAVDGRSMDGDWRYVREEVNEVSYDRDAWREAEESWAVEGQAQVISAYLRSVLGSARYLSWGFDHSPVAYYGERVTLVATEEDSHDPEFWTDHRLTLTGPGVTDYIRRTAYEILASN